MGSRRPTRIPLWSALLLALTAGLTACDSAAEEPPATPSANNGLAVEAGDQYVALGDSYTAAYLTGETDPESGPCARSLANYPRQLAESLDLDLTDVSCGGATTAAVLSPQPIGEGEVPAQITAVEDDTDLVTVSLGANDVDLYGAIIGTCLDLAATDPDGSPCTDLAEGAGTVGDRRLAAARTSLESLIRTIAAKAPAARIVLVGYPQSFPPTAPCEQLPIATGDVALAFDAAAQVNEMVRSTAAGMGVEYVDVWAATEGHDICSDEPWIAGQDPERTDGYAYHPFPEEQRAVADLLGDLLG